MRKYLTGEDFNVLKSTGIVVVHNNEKFIVSKKYKVYNKDHKDQFLYVVCSQNCPLALRLTDEG